MLVASLLSLEWPSGFDVMNAFPRGALFRVLALCDRLDWLLLMFGSGEGKASLLGTTNKQRQEREVCKKKDEEERKGVIRGCVRSGRVHWLDFVS
jgi:hypothetical protein